jgi:hypothetical protein
VSAARSLLSRVPGFALARLLRLNLLARGGAHQHLEDFAGQVRPPLPAGAKRVLVATNIGGQFALAGIDRMLALALRERGAAVTSVLCDAALPACQMCEISLVGGPASMAAKGPPALLCSYCHPPARTRLQALSLPVVRLGDAVTEEDRREAAAIAASTAPQDVPALVWQGMAVGEHASAGALRFFAKGSLADEPTGPAVLRRYLEATILAASAYERLIESEKPEVVVAHHGIYTPQGAVNLAARKTGVRLVTWNPAYRKHCFIFSHDDTYHHTLIDEDQSRWAERPLTPAQRERIASYLASRREGGADWIRFHKDPDYAASQDLARFGLDPAKPLVVAYTNVFWDAQLHYPRNAFASQREWLVETIRWFAARPELQLLIRIHPAEISGNPRSRQLARDAIAEAFPELPRNVAVVGPESPVSSYVLAEMADSVVIFATKMGVELSATGKVVIVAGEAWVRNKGITRDAGSRAHYFELLEQLPVRGGLDHETRERALAYAYHFFMRRMIELPFVQPDPGPRRFTVALDSVAGLRQGADPGLDAICAGILEGTPFEMPE